MGYMLGLDMSGLAAGLSSANGSVPRIINAGATRLKARNSRMKIMPSVIGTTPAKRFSARSNYSNCPVQASE